MTWAAIDGSEIPMPDAWRASPGAYGCALTHLSALEHAFVLGTGTLLVLEDDAVFAPDFPAGVSRLADVTPDDWDMVMLGGQHRSAPQAVATGVVRCVETQRTHAYLIRHRAIPTLLACWRSANDHIDHQADVVQAALNVYAPSPLLVGQAAGQSDIVGHEFPLRWWNPTVDFCLP